MTRFSLLEGDHVAPAQGSFLEAVREGLLGSPKRLPPAILYDAEGSRLFEEITRQPEYYLTRTEASILRARANELAALDVTTLVELGSGNSEKTRILLDAFSRDGRPIHYIAIDISKEILVRSTKDLLNAYPSLKVTAVAAEYSEGLRRFDLRKSGLVLFLGSSIGNMEPREAEGFVRSLRRADAHLLLGFDMKKAPSILLPAYDDAAGVTRAFERNVLTRINRELGADFDPARFDYRAVWNEAASRVEMYLVAREAHEVSVADFTVRFRKGESIRTECSYKFTTERILGLAKQAGFRARRFWTDSRGWFSLVLFSPDELDKNT